MTTELVIQLILASGLGAVILAIVNGLFGRKKTTVDVTAVIVDSAEGAVSLASRQRAELAEKVGELEQRMSGFEARAEKAEGDAADAKASAATATARANAAEGENAHLRRRVDHLEDALRANGIPIPNGTG